MAWSVEIHHIDVRDVGDSTIIRVVDTTTPANNRLVLIDGGTGGAAGIIHQYITARWPATDIDAIVVTHYDRDHIQGIIELLELGPPVTIYNNVKIYDPGQPPDHPAYYVANTRPRGGGKARRVEHNYLKFIKAIRNKPNIRRATLKVNNFQLITYNAAGQRQDPGNPAIPGKASYNTDYYRQDIIGQASLNPYWLLDKDILWGNGGDNGVAAVNPKPGVNAPLAPLVWAEAIPANAPTLTCIAANKWTLQNGGPPQFVSTVNRAAVGTANQANNLENGFDKRAFRVVNRNQSSLAFVLRFNNFKYYIGGDLEIPQEDGDYDRNVTPALFKNGVRQYLNQNDNMAGRVSVARTSHHGSRNSTSREFITQLRPSAAIISNGRNNTHDHPAQDIINILDGYQSVPINADPTISNKHPPAPPTSPFRSVTHYLTGFNDPTAAVFNDKTYGGTDSWTAGSPTANPPAAQRGNIVFTISEAESQRPVEGYLYRAIFATIDRIVANLPVPGVNAAQAHAIAQKGATYGVYRAVATAVGAPDQAANAALAAAAYVGSGPNPQSLLELTNAAANRPAAVAILTPLVTAGAGPGGRPAFGLGFDVGVAHTVKGRTPTQIHAAINGIGGANADAATAAGIVGPIIRQFGSVNGGFAAAAAIGAVNIPPIGQKANVLQAIALGSAIGSEAAGAAGAVANLMVQAIYDCLTDAALGGGAATPNQAALLAAIATVCAYKGETAHMHSAIQAALVKASGATTVAAIAAAAVAAAGVATAAINQVNLGGGNDLFQVDFYDANPAYTTVAPGAPPAVQPRRIPHKS